MNVQWKTPTGYHAAREAERLIGHYLLAMAILGEEAESQLELACLRVAQRRRQRALERVEAAALVC